MNKNHLLKQEIKFATNEQSILACYQVIKQLRPHFTSEQKFVLQVQRQMQQGYKLIFIEQEVVRAVSGYRYLEFLAWGKVLYIDDLVTDSSNRKNGYASTLVDFLFSEAKKEQCDQVHLDSGPLRHDAHRLYLSLGFKITGHHFSFNLKE